MKETSFGARLGRALWGVIRFLTVLILLGGVLAAVYFGAPALYERYIMPIENSNARLQAALDDQQAQIESLQTQMVAMQARLGRLETAQTETNQALTDLTSQQTALLGKLDQIETTLTRLDVLQVQLDTLSASVESYQPVLDDLNTGLQDLDAQVQILRTAQTLSRARLYLTQNNYGLAAQDIERTLAFLEQMPADEMVQRAADDLRQAQENLPDHPVVAADHMNIAWETLLGLMPASEPTP